MDRVGVSNWSWVSGWSWPRLIGMAAVLGAIMGFAAVYVTKGGDVHPQHAVCSPERAAIEALNGLAVGELAAFRVEKTALAMPDLAFLDQNAKAVTLSQMRGKVLLVNLWATWCAPCRQEMPGLDALMAKTGGDDFAVVAISLDLKDPAIPQGFMREIGLKSLPFYHDRTGKSLQGLRAAGLGAGLPVSVLVDRKGCVLGNLAGPAEWASPEALALIGAAIGRKSGVTQR